MGGDLTPGRLLIHREKALQSEIGMAREAMEYDVVIVGGGRLGCRRRSASSSLRPERNHEVRCALFEDHGASTRMLSAEPPEPLFEQRHTDTSWLRLGRKAA